MSEQIKRHQLQEKQAFHNIMIQIPYFISTKPTNIVAISKQKHPLLHTYTHQFKLYRTRNHIRKIPIIFFQDISTAISFVQNYRKEYQHGWCQYCRDVNYMQGIFYQVGKIYVPYLWDKEFKEFIDEVSQIVVLDGVAAQEAMRRSQNSLFRFLDQVVTFIVRILSVWSIFTTDGEYTPTLWVTAIKSIEVNRSK